MTRKRSAAGSPTPIERASRTQGCSQQQSSTSPPSVKRVGLAQSRVARSRSVRSTRHVQHSNSAVIQPSRTVPKMAVRVMPLAEALEAICAGAEALWVRFDDPRGDKQTHGGTEGQLHVDHSEPPQYVMCLCVWIDGWWSLVVCVTVCVCDVCRQRHWACRWWCDWGLKHNSTLTTLNLFRTSCVCACVLMVGGRLL
jgi:hypothetical protein